MRSMCKGLLVCSVAVPTVIVISPHSPSLRTQLLIALASMDPLLFRDNPEAFASLPYWQQWDKAVAFVAHTGNRSGLVYIIFHMFVFAMHVAIFWLLPPPGDHI